MSERLDRQINALASKELPADSDILARCEPVYESWPGWRSETGEAGCFKDLPPQAQRYLKRLEALLGVPICLLSTGSRREQAFKIGAW